jgi:tripartite-type tricarboxylate transporter receptor subunit TctC
MLSRLGKSAALGLIVWSALSPAQAQTWPTRPLHIIVPFTAGSTVDLAARVVMEQVGRQVGQPAVIESRLGAGGTVASAAVAKSEPDGHTILFTSSAYSITPLVQTNLPYDPTRDLSGVTPAVTLPNVLVIAPDRPFKTLPAMIAAAKANPKLLTYATVGPGSASHVMVEGLKLKAGFQALAVPFKGPSEALNEVVAGRMDFIIVPTLTAQSLMQAGKVLPVAAFSTRRAPDLPDVPTTVELGYPDSTYNFWFGALLSAKTPRSIVDRLNAEIVKAIQLPEIRDRLAKFGAQPFTTTPAEFDALIKKELADNLVIVRAAGLAPK